MNNATPQNRKELIGANDRYLRNRPFFLVYFSAIPHKIQKNEDGIALEGENDIKMDTITRYVVVDRVSKKHELEAAIILDVVNMKIIRDMTQSTTDEVMEFLNENFKDEITEVMHDYLAKRAKDLKNAGMTIDQFNEAKGDPEG